MDDSSLSGFSGMIFLPRSNIWWVTSAPVVRAQRHYQLKTVSLIQFFIRSWFSFSLSVWSDMMRWRQMMNFGQTASYFPSFLFLPSSLHISCHMEDLMRRHWTSRQWEVVIKRNAAMNPAGERNTWLFFCLNGLICWERSESPLHLLWCSHHCSQGHTSVSVCAALKIVVFFSLSQFTESKIHSSVC